MLPIVLAVLAASDESCTVEKDVDFKTPASPKKHMKSPEECCGFCTNNTQCVAYSWKLFGDESNGTCWLTLLPATPGRVASKGYVSGIIPGTPTPPPTPAVPTPIPPTPIPSIPCPPAPAPSPPPPYSGPFNKFQDNVAFPEQQPNCTFGQPWVDDSNHRIDAHGAGILHDSASNKYYWYGTKRFNHTQHPTGHPYIPSPGVNCYSSSDLYNWHFEGFVFNASLTGGEQVERPKVIYNEKTKTYVLWSKIIHSGHQLDGSGDMAVVAVSGKPTGPFELANGVQWFPPDNRCYADATLFVDDTGTAYTAFRGAGKTDKHVHVYRLTDDYLNVTTDSVSVPMFEGLTMFQHQDSYFLWGSELSPYPPAGKPFHTNPVLYMSKAGPLGNYSRIKGKGHLDAGKGTWAAQSTFVLPNPEKKDANANDDALADFVWMGDAWLVDEYFFGLYTWLPLYVNTTGNGSARLEWRTSWALGDGHSNSSTSAGPWPWP